MKNKYYTPTIEEFHVGFEYEHYEDFDVLPEKKWNKHVYGPNGANPEGIDYVSQYTLDLECIRVKHLDREDIESFGFDFITINQGKTNDFFMKQVDDPRYKESASIGIGVCYVSHQVVIEFEIDTTKETKGPWYIDSNAVFAGKIKNKSELKRVLTQIGVV